MSDIPTPQKMRFQAGPHLFALLSAIVIGYFMLSPNDTSDGKLGPSSVFLNFGHLAAFAASFGTQFWTTFIAGIVMFRTLPRPHFGNLQAVLFPKYFLIVMLASVINLSIYASRHPYGSWSKQDWTQIVSLSLVFLSSVVNFLYLVPKSTEVMYKVHAAEKESKESGDDAELKKLRRQFGILHGISSIGNLVGLIGNGVHLYFLAANAISI